MDDKLKLKPLSSNPVAAFFQKIWRWWQGVWCGFKEKHPKAAGLIYMLFFFIVFSQGVTIWQFLVMLFLPRAFEGLWTTPFVWPAIPLGITDASGSTLFYAIFNEPVKFMNGELTMLANDAAQVAEYQNAGYVLKCSGIGNFIAFEIAVFTAQCINFPLQRNITYRSHGNPWYQAMWYFIGWVLISVFVNAVWGIVNPFVLSWGWNDFWVNLLKTFITGGVSMAIFFFIFLLIFPNVDKDAENKAKKAAAAVGTPNEAKAQLVAQKAEEVRLVFHAEKAIAEAKSLAESRIASYLSLVKLQNSGNATAEQVEVAKEKALAAVETRDTVMAEQTAVLEQVKAARAARANA